jgi:hypothetical protein
MTPTTSILIVERLEPQHHEMLVVPAAANTSP